MFEQTVPNWLMGVWRRRSIEENGVRDTTTQVTWIQTNCCFGDIRIPADRFVADLAADSAEPMDLDNAERLARMSDRSAFTLSKQEGFAGVTQYADGCCEWHRMLDYCPPTGQRDRGTLHWEGDTLVEIGPNDAYVEEWQRIGNGTTAAMTVSSKTNANETAWEKWLVVCGDYFIYMCDRRPALPQNKSLTELLETDTTGTINSQNRQPLNCEVSLGRCTSGQIPWEIKQSTLPWKEGSRLWHPDNFSIDRKNNKAVQTIGTETVTWEIQEWGALEDLLMPALASV